MFKKVLIANRGAIACRVIRTLRRMGIASVAVYSEADTGSLHVAQADEAVLLGPSLAAESYLDAAKVLAAAKATGAEAIHPGYGFLSENAGFAEACRAEGIAFIGPAPEHLRAFGLKHTARELAAANAVPLAPGSGLVGSLAEAQAEAARIGFPVMLKSTAGGGGIGMQVCSRAEDLAGAYETVARLSQANFKDGGMFLEKFVARARHIEVQIFGDGKGEVIAIGERDCSLQRRNQKVVEETPAPDLPESIRQELFGAAERLGRAVSYANAGTVEFLYDADTREFYFLEVNTRLQVEHGVTEQVTGVDLVEWMVRQAAGELELKRPEVCGASIQVRVYAEDPGQNFRPSSGQLTAASFPSDARVETWVERGSEITPFYDPMIAKVIVTGDNREDAIAKLEVALAQTTVAGIATNVEYLRQVVASPVFRSAVMTTSYLNTFNYVSHAVDILDGGTQTTVQDYPGRLGYWEVGVPPSGPMDSLAFRLANRLVGNAAGAAGLECTVTGPTLKFRCDAVVALTGADMEAKLDGKRLPRWQAIAVKAGQTLRMNQVVGAGIRAYLAVRGGFDVPEYLGSRATFALGKFGGHGGRVLRAGDVLPVTALVDGPVEQVEHPPEYGNRWEIGVLYGPYGAPDYMTDGDIAMFFATDWKVHYNSDRTGVRLIGPKPEWARKDGGEAGLHPSNVHDNAYAVGTVDFTGDMPIILGPDGPSLGGFVCPATIVAAELWKMGQLKAGDAVRFRRMTNQQAVQLEWELDRAIDGLTKLPTLFAEEATEPAIVKAHGDTLYRTAGDKYLLVEFGEPVLDMKLRFRVQAMAHWLTDQQIPGVIDITPGIRTLQVHYDSRQLSRAELLDILAQAEGRTEEEVPSRIVHLPLSWEDPQTLLAIQKYMQSVRPDAPWCPSNIEFIRRINGLDSVEDVKKIVFDASYLVMGLGDVYLGAPVATPTDPRHRLVTTKYNPARTWTPENAVGIGGAYLCVYGMEGPGGYQFVGRTIQMWNTYKSTDAFEAGKPWLLRGFDQIRFFPVSAEELLEYRKAFPLGRYPVKIEPTTYRLAPPPPGAAEFKAKQQAAFEAERERWGKNASVAEVFEEAPPAPELDVPPGCRALRAPTTASVWSVEIAVGQTVSEGGRLVILEAMKMEVAVCSPVNGLVRQVLVAQGGLVQAGQALLIVEEAPDAE
jgi:urea carboxylase